MLLIGVHDYRKADIGYYHGDGFLGDLHRTKVGNHSLTHSLTNIWRGVSGDRFITCALEVKESNICKSLDTRSQARG